MSENQSWLIWGLKESFLSYVARLPGSEASVGEGAGFTESREFSFPVRSHADDGSTSQYYGDLKITAYGGMLDVELGDPWIEQDGSSIILSVRTGAAESARTAIAQLTPTETSSDDPSIRSTYRANLLKTGSQIFNHVYEPGQELAIVRVVGLPGNN